MLTVEYSIPDHRQRMTMKVSSQYGPRYMETTFTLQDFKYRLVKIVRYV